MSERAVVVNEVFIGCVTAEPNDLPGMVGQSATVRDPVRLPVPTKDRQLIFPDLDLLDYVHELHVHVSAIRDAGANLAMNYHEAIKQSKRRFGLSRLVVPDIHLVKPGDGTSR